MLIMVTGRSGSGKSMLARELARKLNIEYVDIDKVGHSVYQDKVILKRVEELFGKGVFENGTVNRKKLGKVIFSEQGSERVKEFNKITYAYMEKVIDKKVENDVVLDWILLPTTKYWKMEGKKILVKAESDNVRFEKIKERDNVTDEYLQNREKAAISYNEEDFDFILMNDYSEKFIETATDKILNEMENERE